MTEVGAELGFKFDYFEDMRIVNTRDAHILLDYAKENGKQTELKMRLVESFFSERKDVSIKETLKLALEEVGLNVDEGMARLDSDDARNKVQTEEAYWQNLGVTSVPTIVFNKKSAVTGAQPVAVFKEVLNELLQENIK